MNPHPLIVLQHDTSCGRFRSLKRVFPYPRNLAVLKSVRRAFANRVPNIIIRSPFPSTQTKFADGDVMNEQPFLRPRLSGARFEDHAIPLEVLGDLAVLEEMIIEVAKWIFLQEHTDRKRSPKGFTEGITLKLTGVESGSALPVIELVVTSSATLFPPENQLCFEQARDAIASAIAAAEQNKPIIGHLPERALGYFDRLGRSLRDGEAIEFERPSNHPWARLTKETRRRLVLASSTVKELTEETAIRGTVPEADQDAMTFEVQLFDGRKVKAPMALQHLDTIIDAFKGYKAEMRVLVQGVGRFNRSERLLGFESIEHISILDPLDVSARLDELRHLNDGWLDGQGKAPQSTGLDWLANAFERNFPENIPLPRLYPTLGGGIHAEWSLGVLELSLEIDLESRRGQWHSLNTDTDSESDRQLDLADPDDWKWLVTQIKIAGEIT